MADPRQRVQLLISLATAPAPAGKTPLDADNRHERATAAIKACMLIQEHHLLDAVAPSERARWDPARPPPQPPPRSQQRAPWDDFMDDLRKNQEPPGHYTPPKQKPAPPDAYSSSPPKQGPVDRDSSLYSDFMDDILDGLKDTFGPKQRPKKSKNVQDPPRAQDAPRSTQEPRAKSKIISARRSGTCKGCDVKFTAGDRIIHRDGYGDVIAHHVSCVLGLEAWC